MSMVKVIAPESQDFGEQVSQIVQLSSRGLSGSDRDMFIKRASVDFLKDLDSLREKVGSGEVLLHLIALGSTEAYGPNRNGDGFRAAVCEQYHPTFVKNARFYRDHKNKDKAKSYGRVIKSAFNRQMGRVELLCAINGTEKAAKANGGLVADRELEKLAAGKDIPVSMACLVPDDICSYCGNVAPTVREYCRGVHQGGHCKAGGLRDNIGALVEIDGGIHHLHADNAKPNFFDISHVVRPADRIAYVLGQLEKSAAVDSRIIKSADLARQLGVSMPVNMLASGCYPANVQRMMQYAVQMADTEAVLDAGLRPKMASLAAAVAPGATNQPAIRKLPGHTVKFASVLKALATQRICLPLPQFIELVTDHSREKAAEVAEIVSRRLPGIYTRLVADSTLPDKLQASRYTAADTASAECSLWAAKYAADYSLLPVHLERRAQVAAIRDIRPVQRRNRDKIAAAIPSADRLAEEYAIYQLSFLDAIPDTDPSSTLTADLLVIQNYTC